MSVTLMPTLSVISVAAPSFVPVMACQLRLRWLALSWASVHVVMVGTMQAAPGTSGAVATATSCVAVARTVAMVATLLEFISEIALRGAPLLLLGIFIISLPSTLGLYNVLRTRHTALANMTMSLCWYCPLSFFWRVSFSMSSLTCACVVTHAVKYDSAMLLVGGYVGRGRG